MLETQYESVKDLSTKMVWTIVESIWPYHKLNMHRQPQNLVRYRGIMLICNR